MTDTAAPAKGKQKTLELGERPRWTFRKLQLDDVLVEAAGAPPEPELVRSVAIEGVLVPILVREFEEGRYAVIDGRRRVVAARTNELRAIPAMVAKGGNIDLHGPTALLEANDTASPNPIVELEAIEELMRLSPGVSVAQIAKATGIKLKTVKARMRLSGLGYELRDAAKASKFGVKVLEQAARCDADQQRELVHILEATDTLTVEDVKKVRGTDVRGHQRVLPGERVVERAIETCGKVREALVEQLGADHQAVHRMDEVLEALKGEVEE